MSYQSHMCSIVRSKMKYVSCSMKFGSIKSFKTRSILSIEGVAVAVVDVDSEEEERKMLTQFSTSPRKKIIFQISKFGIALSFQMLKIHTSM